MNKVLQCDCGFEASDEDEDQLVAEIQRHASEAHEMTLTREEALLLAFRAELNAEALSTALHDKRNAKEEE